jgi:hypothetical protein
MKTRVIVLLTLCLLFTARIAGAQSPVPANGSFTTNLAGWSGNGWTWTNQGYTSGGANGTGDKDFHAPLFLISSSSYLSFWLRSLENDPQCLAVKINGVVVRSFCTAAMDGWQEFAIDLTPMVGIGTAQLSFNANGKKFVLDEVIVHAGAIGGGGGGGSTADPLLDRLTENAPLTAGAVWAVLILLLFVLLSKPKQRTLQVISAMLVISLPLSLINAGVWAVTLYIFVVLYQVIASVFRLFE